MENHRRAEQEGSRGEQNRATEEIKNYKTKGSKNLLLTAAALYNSLKQLDVQKNKKEAKKKRKGRIRTNGNASVCSRISFLPPSCAPPISSSETQIRSFMTVDVPYR